MVLGEKLGGGASGEVFAAVYRGRDVAVKVSHDGLTLFELDETCLYSPTLHYYVPRRVEVDFVEKCLWCLTCLMQWKQ